MNLASKSGSVSQVVSGRSIWFLRGLCATGLGISGYLAWTAFQMGEVFGCGSGGSVFDCSHVLSSKWSKVFGVPVSVPAFGLYASLLTLLAFIRRDAPAPFRRLLWSGMTLGALMAGLAALWFIGLQVFVLKHLCWYCLTVHTCGLILSVLMLRGKSLSFADKSRLAMIAALGVAGLMSIQIISREEDHFEVVNFDELPAETEAVASAEELAPGEVFSAPGEEVFEAPVPDVFEAPGSESVSAPVESGVAPSKDSAPVNADSAQPVATNVLTILLPRFSFLMQMPVISQDAAATNSQESQAAESQEAKPADAKPADESKPAAVAPPAAPEPRKVTVASNRMTLNAMQWPILGKPDAEVIFVEMFDYTCPHCRSTHSAVKGALQKYGNKVAILALPVPLEAKCNPAAGGGGHAGACDLAKIAITVWRVNPAKFQEFHDWLFENQVTPATARGKAEQLVGADVFRKEYDSKIPSEYVKRHVELYKKVGSGSVPKLIFEKTMLNGSVGSRESLCAAIEREYPQL